MKFKSCWAPPIQPQNSIKFPKKFCPKCQTSTKICLKCPEYALFFALSRRFGDPYRKLRDSVCIWETRSRSWHRSMHLLFEEAMFLPAIHHTVHLHHEHLSTKHKRLLLICETLLKWKIKAQMTLYMQEKEGFSREHSVLQNNTDTCFDEIIWVQFIENIPCFYRVMAKELAVCIKDKCCWNKTFLNTKRNVDNDAKYISHTCLKFSFAKELFCATFNFIFVFCNPLKVVEQINTHDNYYSLR